MADGNVFAALPSNVKAGGGATDQIGQLVRLMAADYEHRSGYNTDDKPWGSGDETAAIFEEKYVPVHIDLRDTVNQLAVSLTSAADLTINSGKQFHNAQDDAHHAIDQNGQVGGGHGPHGV